MKSRNLFIAFILCLTVQQSYCLMPRNISNGPIRDLIQKLREAAYDFFCKQAAKTSSSPEETEPADQQHAAEPVNCTLPKEKPKPDSIKKLTRLGVLPK